MHVAEAHSEGAGAARAPLPRERAALLRWLDDGLRGGRRGRLLAEYPTAFSPDDLARHRVVWDGDAPAAHALALRVDARIGATTLPLGLVGSVYSDPRQRGRGLARRCVESAVEVLRERGAALAVLWTDLDAFYAPLGFTPAGMQSIDIVDSATLDTCARALTGPEVEVGAPRDRDWPRLEALYLQHPSRAERPPGALRRLADAPECETLVAHRDGVASAYVACGRGDDMRDIVHEWAGDASGLHACLARLLDSRSCVGVLSGPVPHPLVGALRSSGAQPHRGPFAHVRLLEPAALWRSCGLGARVRDGAADRGERAPGPEASWEVEGRRVAVSRDGRSVSLDATTFVHTLLGPEDADTAHARTLLGQVVERDVLAATAAVPLFLWGFDSI